MIKKFFRLFGCVGIIAVLLATAPLSAKSETMEELKARQTRLENKIEALEKRLDRQNEDTADGSESDASALPAYIEEDVQEMSDRLDKIETKSILDKIKLGGEFRTRLETIRYTDHLFTGVKSDGSSDEIWSNRLRLTLRSDILDNLIFHGRLTYYKLWGEFTYDQDLSDWSYPSYPDQDGNLHVERAYVDYFIPHTPLSITFGRMPASDGPPNELKDFTTRKSTWPVLMNDVEADGLIATLHMTQWTGLRNNLFRLAYSKFQQHYLRYKDTLSPFDDVRVWAAALETEVPVMKNSLFWISFGRMDLAPAKGAEGIVSYPESTGYSDIYACHLQFNDLFDTGLDWFGAFTHVYVDTKPVGTRFANGYEVSIYTDNAHGTIGDNYTGNAFFTGLRYRLPIQSMLNPLIGIEYNYGSKYWLGLLTSGSGSLVNKLDVHGNAYEIYYIQPIHDNNMFARLGFIYMDHDYYGPLFGEPRESDMVTTDLYLLVDVRF